MLLESLYVLLAFIYVAVEVKVRAESEGGDDAVAPKEARILRSRPQVEPLHLLPLSPHQIVSGKVSIEYREPADLLPTLCSLASFVCFPTRHSPFAPPQSLLRTYLLSISRPLFPCSITIVLALLINPPNALYLVSSLETVHLLKPKATSSNHVF